jgi:hypothetical protein
MIITRLFRASRRLDMGPEAFNGVLQAPDLNMADDSVTRAPIVREIHLAPLLERARPAVSRCLDRILRNDR